MDRSDANRGSSDQQPVSITSQDGPGPKKASITDRQACMECGACARNCPTAALSVRPGVGCAAAIIIGKLKGSAPDCACGCGEGCC